MQPWLQARFRSTAQPQRCSSACLGVLSEPPIVMIDGRSSTRLGRWFQPPAVNHLCVSMRQRAAPRVCAAGLWLYTATALTAQPNTADSGWCSRRDPICARAALPGLGLRMLRGGGGVVPVLHGRRAPSGGGGGDGSGDDSNIGVRGGGFPTLTAKDGEALAVESLCMECGEQGTTRILPTTIPRFGQVVIMAFECAACNHTSNTVQSAADIRPLGVQYTLRCSPPAPLRAAAAALPWRPLRAGTRARVCALTPSRWHQRGEARRSQPAGDQVAARHHPPAGARL